MYYENPVELCKNVDNLFIALKGGAATKGFVSENFLKALGRNGILINISRGSVIDENSLLDVLEKENIWSRIRCIFGRTKYKPKVFEFDNVFIQPHQASATIKTRQAMGDLQYQNIASYFENGKPLTVVPEMK